MSDIQFKRGPASRLPTSAKAGEPIYCPDTGQLFIGNGAGKPLTDTRGSVGPQGEQGVQGLPGQRGVQGPVGSQGPPGPNSISGATATSFNGLLKGNGTTVGQAVAGTDYVAPSALAPVATSGAWADLTGKPVGVVKNLKDDFGAKGDGATDDTAALQAALDSGYAFRIPKATYKINTFVSSLNRTAPIDIIAESGAIFDGSDSTATTLISVGGGRSTSAALSGNATVGANTFTTSLASSLAAGDVVLLSTDAYSTANPGTPDLWDVSRPYYYRGEMVRVKSISDTTITTETPLHDSYNAATTTAYKLVMPQVRISGGLEITRNSNHAGLLVQYAQNIGVSGITAHGARERLFYFLYCFGGKVAGLNGTDFWYSGTGTSYGISIASCQNLTVQNCRLTGGRHAIAHGGWEPCRNIRVVGNVLQSDYQSTVNTLDSHENSEFVEIVGNFIYDGISWAGRNVNIHDNPLIISNNSYKSAIQINISGSQDYIRIHDNPKISANAGTNPAGIQVLFKNPNITVNRLITARNNIYGQTGAISITPYASSSTGCTIINLVSDSDIGISESSQAYVIGVNASARITVTNHSIVNGYFTSNNYSALGLSPVLGTGSLNIGSSKFQCGLQDARAFYITGYKDVTIKDSSFNLIGSATTFYDNQIMANGKVRVVDTQIASTRYNLINAPNATWVMLRNNEYNGSVGSIVTGVSPVTTSDLDFTIAGKITATGLATYADNAAATAGGLAAGAFYKTATGQLMVRY